MAALSQTRVPKFGTLECENYHVLYSGKDGIKAAGVALALRGVANKCLLDWEPVNDRILRARFATTYAKTTCIAVYAPTNESCESYKDTFYQSLNDVTNKIRIHDILVVCGDFNAKVGCHQDYAPTVIDSHGLGEVSKNGMRLIDFCVINYMIVGGT
ncbi:hypothetical protein QYM36_014773 [Artemia franciscana]|uniref:Craniofacial development protein 2-like n=1 Tax=Artemia franciscana TaxID=6661 RepID=A0AA88L3V5_ARTSF|nr:hypothetical protein QYM36_014773 [Artemia franciscana]